ncbi:MFS family permease [Anaerosolibacter carboniphilus]|uniref:MFS family permease n=1 Tax=Anaerosolibacter carboniphilus TaxID=1417629 RepID=A0A841KNF4_9FIRM|nr:MFS transporter [Anaerosolibacter carboniphilus]MBB6215334.1 MFS family permease [Anaerosolibacter carboniphilus]
MGKNGNKIENTNLMLFFLGRMVSDTGSSIQMVIMPLYIIDAGGSAATVGLFTFLYLMPALLVYPFAGVLGDRLNRKIIMVVTDLSSAVVILGLALGAYTNRMNLTLLLSVQIIVSLLYGLFDPATKGMLPQLVTKEELTRANSTLATLRILANLLGPVIGTALYASKGITVVLFINGISFLLSGISELLIRYKYVKRESAQGVSGFVEDLSKGVSVMLANKVIIKLCGFSLATFVLIQPVYSTVLPIFFRTQLAYSDTQYAYMQMVIVLGALLGSILVGLLFGKEKNVTKPLVIGCSLLMGTMLTFSILLFPNILSFIGNGTVLYFALLIVVLSLLTTAFMFINVPIQTLIQRATPNEYMSRVFSIVGMITKGGLPLGALVYGIVLSGVEMHWAVLAATLMMMLISVKFFVSFLKAHDL